jgi:hypothetical protein
MSTHEPTDPHPPAPPAPPAPPPLPVLPVADVPAPETDDETASGLPPTSTCPTCGAQLSYAPGTTALECEACGSEHEIALVDAQVREHSLDEWHAANRTTRVAHLAAHELQCRSCGATSETTELSTACQFCGGALVAVESPEGLVEPEGVIPFQVDRSQARDAFRAWVSSRRFAPSSLRQVGATEGLTGTYLPHWTYDAHTESDYRGQRGDHYYVTRTRQVSDGNGGTRTETYQERRTRWRRKHGHVRRDFDDVLVLASHALDPEKVDEMAPWHLGEARPFQPEFLTGYSTIRYDVDPLTGAESARRRMVATIEQDVRRDIGGDEQRIHDLDVEYSDNTFKLLLMPLWIASYLHAGTTYQVLVNARTGEVVGDRPYSAIKIALAVLAALAVVAAIVGIVLLTRGQ